MHGLFENIAPAMLRHWSGTFLKDDNSNYILSDNEWKEIIFITTFTKLSSRKVNL
jgi:hypothetical protein